MNRYIKYNDSVPTIIDTKENKLISGIDGILDLVNYLELRNKIMNTNVLKENNKYYRRNRDEWRTKYHDLEDEVKKLEEVISENEKMLSKDLDMLTELRQKIVELQKTNLELSGDYLRLYCFVKRLNLSEDDLKKFKETIGDEEEDNHALLVEEVENDYRMEQILETIAKETEDGYSDRF